MNKTKLLEQKDFIINELKRTLILCLINDRSKIYGYGEKRIFDNKIPPVGQRWLTPREIVKQTLKELDKEV